MILIIVLRVDSVSNTHTLLRLYQGTFPRCLLLFTHRLCHQCHRDQFRTVYITSLPLLHHAAFLRHIHIIPSRNHPTINSQACTRHIYPMLPPPIAPHSSPPSLRRLFTRLPHTKRQNMSLIHAYTRIRITRTSKKKCAPKEAHPPHGLVMHGVTPIRWRYLLHKQRLFSMLTMRATQWKYNPRRWYRSTRLAPASNPTIRCLPTMPPNRRASSLAASYTSALARSPLNGVFPCLDTETRCISNFLPLTKYREHLPTQRHRSSVRNLRAQIVRHWQSYSL